MFDELKDKTMQFLGLVTDEQYFNNLKIYLDNLLASPEVLESINEYIKTQDPNKLTIEAEMRIAKDMFGGFKYGTN